MSTRKMVKQEVLLTKQECQSIIDMIDLDNMGKSIVTYLNPNPNKTLDTNKTKKISEYRTSDEVKLFNNEYINNLLLPKFQKLFEIYSLPISVSFLRYQTGHEFKIHTDNLEGNRVYTLSIQLNEEYEGGNFYIYKDKQRKEKVQFNKTQGNVLVFDSNMEHLVEKITAGTRYAMVMWFERWNLKKGGRKDDVEIKFI